MDADLLDGLNSSSTAAVSTIASRDSNGILFGTNVASTAASGNGIRFWGGDSAYTIYMSSASDGTWGGRVVETSSDYNMYFKMTTANRGFVWKSGTSNIAGLDSSGNLRIIGDITTSASDKRLKTNIRNITDPLTKIKKIQGYVFDWDIKKCKEVGFSPVSETEHGFLAQDFIEILPDAVHEAAFNSEYYGLRYQRVIPLLAAGINELSNENDKLKQEIDDLKSEISYIKDVLSKMINKD